MSPGSINVYIGAYTYNYVLVCILYMQLAATAEPPPKQLSPIMGIILQNRPVPAGVFRLLINLISSLIIRGLSLDQSLSTARLSLMMRCPASPPDRSSADLLRRHR